jgi:hypothetical protein
MFLPYSLLLSTSHSPYTVVVAIVTLLYGAPTIFLPTTLLGTCVSARALPPVYAAWPHHVQVAAFKLDRLAGFGAACRPPLSLPRGDQERLLRRLELLRLVRQETARQETFQSITSVIQVDQVCLNWGPVAVLVVG